MRFTSVQNIKVKIFVIACLLTLIAGMMTVLAPKPVFADDGGLTIDGAIITREVVPGEKFEHQMTVSLGSDAPALDITIEIRGLGQRTNGSYLELVPQEDKPLYSSREYITAVEPAAFYLEPGNSQTVTAKVQVPENIGDGSLYAVLYVKGVPRQQAGITFVRVIDVPVIITHGTLDIKCDITSVDIQDVASGQPIKVSTTINNRGNHHFKAGNAVNLMNAEGTVVASCEEQITPCSIIPGYSYVFTRDIVLTGDIEPGTYTVQSLVNLDGSTEMTKLTPLNLKEKYQPVTATPTLQDTATEHSGDLTEERNINWAFIGIAMGGIVILGILALLIIRRRRPSL